MAAQNNTFLQIEKSLYEHRFYVYLLKTFVYAWKLLYIQKKMAEEKGSGRRGGGVGVRRE